MFSVSSRNKDIRFKTSAILFDCWEGFEMTQEAFLSLSSPCDLLDRLINEMLLIRFTMGQAILYRHELLKPSHLIRL
jgi:hypothetical protein